MAREDLCESRRSMSKGSMKSAQAFHPGVARRHGLCVWWMLTLILCQACVGIIQAQESEPIASDQVFDESENKFLQRKADPSKASSRHDEEPMPSEKCPANLELNWMSEVSSSIYSTPLITDLYSDGHKDIVVPSFVHYLEVLEGQNGAKAAGWPANHKASLYSSPLMFDCDYDGVPDVVIATYDAEIVCYKDTGAKITGFQIEALQVRKDWYVGLSPDHVDHSHPDIADIDEGMDEDEDGPAGEEHEMGELPLIDKHDENIPEAQHASEGNPVEEMETIVKKDSKDSAERSEIETNFSVDANATKESDSISEELSVPSRRKILEIEAENQQQLTDEAQDSFDVFKDDDELEDEEDGDVDWEEELEGEEGAAYDYDEGYDDYDYDEHEDSHMDESDFDYDYHDYEGFHHDDDEIHISIDPHVLCTPAVGDLDGDGYSDIVLAVTYFFDSSYYAKPENRDMLGDDIDISNYLAGGIVAFDALTMSVKWHRHLDLSTHHVKYQAYIYSSPTIADINGDSKPEIIVGTSVGFVYVLDQNGTTLPGWPIQMGEIQAQVVVEDINDDGLLEILACDTHGNIAAFDGSGKEIWERHVGAIITNNPTVGDVNGDGRLEIVVGTGKGEVYTLDGRTGKTRATFKTNAMTMSSVLLAKLDDSANHLHLVTMSFDGFLYIVSGLDGCADVVDIGETSYSMALFEDMDNDGFMDLIVSTMNGNVYSFKTNSKSDGLKSWTSHVPAGNGFASRVGSESISFLPESRIPRDISGKDISIKFEIVDRILPNTGSDALKGLRAPYTVVMKLKGVGVEAMNTGKNPVVGISNIYNEPGTYTLDIPCPRSRTTGTIEIKMYDRNLKSFEDSFAASFHMSYYRILKWLLALPMMAAMITLILAAPFSMPSSRLPS